MKKKNILNIVLFIFIGTLYLVAVKQIQLLKIVIFPVIILTLLMIVISEKRIMRIDNIRILWLVTPVPIIMSIIYSSNITESFTFTLLYLLIIITFILLSLVNFDTKQIIKMNLFYSVLLMLATLFSSILPTLFKSIFYPLLTEPAIRATKYFEIVGTNPGISGQTGTNAFLLLIGVGIIFFTGKFNVLKLLSILLFVYTLLLSGKRGLVLAFILSIVFVYIFIYYNKKKAKKWFYLGAVFFIGLIVLIINYSKIAQFLRLGEADITSGRTFIYDIAWQLFLEKPIFGWGINSFATNPANFFTIDVHNIYLQILVETGIIGFVLILTPILSTLIYTFKLRKRYLIYPNKMRFIIISGYVQVLFIIYGIYGNPFYDYNFFLIYLLFILPLFQLKRKQEGA